MRRAELIARLFTGQLLLLPAECGTFFLVKSEWWANEAVYCLWKLIAGSLINFRNARKLNTYFSSVTIFNSKESGTFASFGTVLLIYGL